MAELPLLDTLGFTIVGAAAILLITRPPQIQRMAGELQRTGILQR